MDASHGGHQTQAVKAGHHHVADHQVGGVAADRVQGGPPVGDRGDPVTGGAQQPGQVLAHVGVVVGDQHPRRQGTRTRARAVQRGSWQPARCFLYERVGGGRDRRPVARRNKGVGEQVGVPEGQADAERGALALDAGRGDGAAVQLDEFLDQGQADAAALVRACPAEVRCA